MNKFQLLIHINNKFRRHTAFSFKGVRGVIAPLGVKGVRADTLVYAFTEVSASNS